MEEQCSNRNLREELDQKFKTVLGDQEMEQYRKNQEMQNKTIIFENKIANEIWTGISEAFCNEDLDDNNQIKLMLKHGKRSDFTTVWRKSDIDPDYPVFFLYHNDLDVQMTHILFKEVLRMLKEKAQDQGVEFKKKFSFFKDRAVFIYSYDDPPRQSAFVRSIQDHFGKK